MKILLVTPRVPYPPYRGDKLKPLNLLRNLSRNHDVKMFSFHNDDADLKNAAELRKLGYDIETVKLSIFQSLFNAASVMVKDDPFQVAYYRSKEMAERIRAELSSCKYDVVYFHLIRSAQYIDAVEDKSILKIIDFTDAISLYLKRYLEIESNPFRRVLIKSELSRIHKYEHIVEKFDHLFVCSEVDRVFLKQKGIKTNIGIINNGVDTDYFSYEDREFEKHRIIFAGNMPYFANHDAAAYFANDIFPLVLRKYNDSRFYIVGQNPPRNIQRLHSEKVIVTGFVNDIKLEYLKSEVNVAPIRFGAGTLNKIVESIILGVPVVSTPMAVAALPDKIKKYILTGSSPAEIAAQVCYVFENPSLRTDFYAEGREVVSGIMNWDSVISEFESFLLNESKNKNRTVLN